MDIMYYIYRKNRKTTLPEQPKILICYDFHNKKFSKFKENPHHMLAESFVLHFLPDTGQYKLIKCRAFWFGNSTVFNTLEDFAKMVQIHYV